MCVKIYLCACVCVHMCVQVHIHTWVCARMSILGVCAHDCRHLGRPEDGIRFPGAEVAGNFELPNGVSIENWTPVLWKDRVFSLIHWAISPASLKYTCLNKLQTYCMACFVCIILKLQTGLKQELTTRLPRHSLFIFFIIFVHTYLLV